MTIWNYAEAKKLNEARTSPEGRWEICTGPLEPGRWHLVVHAYSSIGVQSPASKLLSLTVKRDEVIED